MTDGDVMLETNATETATATADTSRFTQDVHIVPVAREVDRAVLPFLPQNGAPAVLHAHRVILLIPDADPSRRLANRVEELLRPLAQVERQMISRTSPRLRPELDLEQVLSQIASICVREIAAGNRVHINLSSGSKLIAFAAGLIGMAHLTNGRGTIYYVQPSGYSVSEEEFEDHGLSKGMLEVRELQLMPLLLPVPLGMRLLTFLKHRPEQLAEYREIVKFLGDIPGSGYESPPPEQVRSVRNWNNAVTTRLVRNILVPLQQDGLVEIRELGRQRAARLTQRGSLYASLSGGNGDRVRAPL